MKRCLNCGETEDKVELDVEAHLHHGRPYLCKDKKSCEKRKKKRK